MKKSVFIFLIVGAIFAVTGCSQSFGSGDAFFVSIPTFKTYTTSTGLKSNSIKTIVVNNTGVYVGTDGGLSVTTDGGSTWKTYTVADGLISNSINSIYVGWDYMLVATDKGFSETGDNGKTWKTKSTMGSWSFVYDRDYDKIHFLSGDYVCTTTDFSSWSRYCVRRADMPSCVIMASGKVFVSYFGSNITVSSDGGSSWSTCSSGLGSQFVNSLFSSGTTVYAATLGGPFGLRRFRRELDDVHDGKRTGEQQRGMRRGYR